MAKNPGWYRQSQDWEVRLNNQVVGRIGTPPDSSLLLEGAQPRGSYLEHLFAKPLGTTGGAVVVHLWVKPVKGNTFYLIGSGVVPAATAPALGADIATTSLQAILPITTFPLAKQNASTSNRALKVGPGVKVYVGLDRTVAPASIIVWGHGGELIEDIN
jgi:hypothetical protein